MSNSFPKRSQLKRIVVELRKLERLNQNVTEIVLRNSINIIKKRFINRSNMKHNTTVLSPDGHLHEGLSLVTNDSNGLLIAEWLLSLEVGYFYFYGNISH